MLSETDIKQYLPLQAQYVGTNFEGFELRALYKHFPKFIGQTLTNQLAEESAAEALTKKVVPVWIVLTFMEAVPFLDVVLTGTGFGVVSTGTISPASQERVSNLKNACQHAANDYMDILLLFLENNVSTYSDWNQSSLNTGSLISGVSVFDQFVDINISRTKFINFKRNISHLEVTRYSSLLSPEFLAELQAGSDTTVKPLLQRALTFHALADYTMETSPDAGVNPYIFKAESALAKAMAYLKTHLDDYSTYKDYGYEASYDNATDGKDSGFFIMGGIG